MDTCPSCLLRDPFEGCGDGDTSCDCACCESCGDPLCIGNCEMEDDPQTWDGDS